MKLTGKCKEDFEKWFTDSDNHKGFDEEQIALDRKYRLNLFYQLTQSMKYGVYVDFFDSVEDKTRIRILPRVSRGWDGYFTELKECLQIHSSRKEANDAAIEKANEIYNKDPK
jgi:hypothetical protein